ncbi:MAG: type II toxin-antitoxin system antitoxin SocA domain-containing protein [Pseudomonadota bacterium]
MNYTPAQIANTFLSRYGAADGISHMKLQKLVYCVHGWWLAYHNEALVSEKPQVWQYGPVFPSLYNELKVYGTTPIKEPLKPFPFSDAVPIVPTTDSNGIQLIDWVWGRYGHLSAMALSDMTHKPGTAWRKVAESRDYRVPRGLPLEDVDVREEFNLLKKEFEVQA